MLIGGLRDCTDQLTMALNSLNQILVKLCIHAVEFQNFEPIFSNVRAKWDE